MNKLFVLVAVLALTAVGYGEEAAKDTSLDDSSPTVKAPAKPAKKAKKAVKAVKKAPQKAAAAPTTAPVTAPAPVAPAPAAAPTTSTSTPGASVETVASAPASEQALIGEIDLRPSWTHKTGEYHTENEAVLGYKFSKDLSLTAHQVFATNLHNPTAAPSGLNLQAWDGFLKFKANNLAGDPSGLALSYEVRGYAPTDAVKRDNGMITIVRNYLKARHDFSSAFYVVLAEVPIVHIYSRSGEGNVANPVFENRVYLIPGFNILDNLSLEVPIVVQNVRHADFKAGAANNASWAHYVWAYPELLYSVTPNVALGLSWYNYSFVTPDFGKVEMSKGLEQGVAQAVLRATL